MQNGNERRIINIWHFQMRIPALILLSLVVSLCLIQPVIASPANKTSSLIIVLLPATGLTDWTSPRHPQLRSMLNSGAVALMNTRTARLPSGAKRESYDAAILTLSAGMRASAPQSNDCKFYNVDEYLMNGAKAGELYERRLGIHLTNANHQTRYVDPNWQRVIDSNHDLGYQIQLGNLSNSLLKYGVKSYVVTGLPGITINDSALFTSGIDGNVSIIDIKSVPDIATQPSLYTVTLSPNDIDNKIELLQNLAGKIQARLLILSPYASDIQYVNDDRLTPVALWGHDIKSGVLWSPSTRRNGLITNTDIAPTIAALFDVQLISTTSGRPIKILPGHGITTLTIIRSNALEQRHCQIIMPYIAILLGLWYVYCFMALRNRRFLERRIFLIPLSIILALTVSPSLPVCISILSFIIIGLFLVRKVRLAAALTGMSLALATLILIDTLCGAPLLQRSILGYSPIEGARYYGIGNEAMGVFIGSLLMVFVAIWRRYNKAGKVVLLVSMVLIVAVIGTLGSKAGGVIVFTGSFFVLFQRLRNKKLNISTIAYSAAIGIAVLISIAVIDSVKSGSTQSHLGSTLSLILSHGFKQGIDVIVRKVIVELHLLYHSAWALPVWLGWIVLFFVRRRIPMVDHQRLSLADSCATAGLLSLLFNDAGAVACALCMSIVTSRLAYISIYNETENLYEPETASQITLPKLSLITVNPSD